MAGAAGTEAGRIGRAHGLDGSFYVTRPIAVLVGVGRTVTVAGVVRRIERLAGTSEKPILRLDGIASREAVEGLRGEPLVVPREDLPALGPGEYWAHELEGCGVADGEVEIGIVHRLVALPSCEVLEVQRAGEPDLLIPMVRDAVRSVDVGARRIEVNSAFLGET